MNIRFYIATLASLLCAVAAFSGKPLCHVIRYDEDDGLSQWHVTQILQDKRGMIWLGTWNGLNRFDGHHFRCFKSNPGDDIGMTTNRVRNIWLTEEGDILCRIDEEFFMFDTECCTYRSLTAEERSVWSKEMPRTKSSCSLLNKPLDYTDKQGYQWRLTSDGCLSYLDEESGTMEEYPLMEPLSDIRFAYPDMQGNLWLVATVGIYKLMFTECVVEELPQQVQSQIRCCFVDDKGRYWVTGRDDATVRVFSSDNSPLGYLGRDGRLHKEYTSFASPVYCVIQSRTGSIWFGCKPDGLYRLRPTDEEERSFEITHFSAGEETGMLNNGNIYHLREDAHGRLWVATLGGGVNCIVGPEEDSPYFVNQSNELVHYPSELCQKVRYIYITPEGDLLAATTEGLLVAHVPENADWEKMRFRHHQKETGRATSLSCSATMEVLQDKQGRIFVSTESGGVNLMLTEDVQADTLSFHHFNQSNGFPTDVTLSMAESGDGRLWVVGGNQIVLLDSESGEAECFDVSFFHRKCRFSDARPVKLADGRWIFGLQDGAFMLEAGRMKKSMFCPPIALTGLSIQNGETNPAVNGLDTLILRPEERNITLFFAALDYVDGGRTEYTFCLTDGEDEGAWNNIGQNRSVTFLDMKPGIYNLTIRSTNADGVWVDNARMLVIIVTPTFWETGWAVLLWILLGAGLIAALVRTYIYIRSINRRQRETLAAYLALLNPQQEEVPESVAPVVRESPQSQSSSHSLTDEDKIFMQRVMEFVEEHLSDADINIGDMASATATSRSGLNRKMKSILGVTPLDFLREARIKKACQLLEKDYLNISEVAFRCGFSDPKYFSRCFKSSIGISPSEYKNR